MPSSGKDLTNVTTNVVKAFETLDQEERTRVITAVLALLGYPPLLTQGTSTPPLAGTSINGDSRKKGVLASGFSAKGEAWMNQHRVSKENLDQIFHVEDGMAQVVLTSLPGKGDRVNTLDAYLLAGIGALLATNSSDFTDEQARDICRHLGCYDGPNHNKTIKQLGNRFAGSKTTGWKLTGPGLKAAATLVQTVANGENDNA